MQWMQAATFPFFGRDVMPRRRHTGLGLLVNCFQVKKLEVQIWRQHLSWAVKCALQHQAACRWNWWQLELFGPLIVVLLARQCIEVWFASRHSLEGHITLKLLGLATDLAEWAEDFCLWLPKNWDSDSLWQTLTNTGWSVICKVSISSQEIQEQQRVSKAQQTHFGFAKQLVSNCKLLEREKQELHLSESIRIYHL